ncbi:hypothetical protein B0H19DRAFT_976247 [Mycena capillaripes]|nr:hypothetical protein B0H19DRAFT_976247 [Mycena capillaripes]
MSLPPAPHQLSENASITRSEHWHSDGSVVLQAENKQFRVHWSLLALNSSFFRDMQALPQPPDQPSVDGCPVVELSDAVADVEYLLTALYTPTFLSQTALPLLAIGALIRLGRKYDFRNLLDSAVGRLTYENPATLKEYDALCDPVTPRKYTPTRIVPYPGLLFDIVTLAQDNYIVSVLPCAYYRLVLKGLNDFLDGIARDDGTVASLAPVDLGRCIRGRERLLHAQLQPGYTCGWYQSWKRAKNCNLGPCIKTLDKRLRTHLNHRTPSMKALGHFLPTASNNKDLCATCKQNISELNAAGREKTWNELPGLFDLPAWNELKHDP